ncbi:MAG: hypothetical protein NZ528_07890 [Caldilineales bacterium]|nr:hypothetical protein [Caldilineales bacterium]MDW8318327.1 hypothetical protein [Anaerolineae bacterium]
MIAVRHLETVLRRAPLGLRFVDLARAAYVTDGLEVAAWAMGGGKPGRPAVRSPLSGVYGFRTLPGLRPYEVGERPAGDWCPSADAAPNFVVYVEDRLGRFLPQVLSLCLPREHLVEVPLFSAPARAPLPGMAVVRGELWDRAGQRPAGWAMVTASVAEGASYVAIADARGMFVLFVPYASALPPLSGSPPPSSGGVDQLAWPVVVRVFYQPAQQEVVPGANLPHIRSILEQDRAEVYDTAAVHGPSITRTLRFGQDLVVTTEGLAPPHRSRLLVEAA